MIYLFLILFSFSSLACNNFIPEREAIKAINLDPSIQVVPCSVYPSDACFCYDDIIWQAAEIVTIDSVKILRNNEQRRIEYLALIESQRQMNLAMDAAKKAQQCGKDTLAYILVRNAPKNLTTLQVNQLLETYSQIKSLLESGSLTTAKEAVLAVVADGVIITNEDKVAVAAFIDSCR